MLIWLASFLAAAALSYGLLLWLKPLLARHTLAKPNSRSSHKVPTPQGGGIAVIVAVLLVATAGQIVLDQEPAELTRLAIIFAATVGLAFVGAIDDMRPLDPLPRLVLQIVAVAVVIATLPDQVRIVPFLPWWADRALLLVGGVWLVNVVNFMDGIDWMTVAEIVPVAGALGLFGLMGVLPPIATLVALALCGAMIGFAPFNRPVAQLFLGDVGSLPIGLLLSWLLAMLADTGHPAAALLLPLYYLADATITLLMRLSRGEQITQAHRSHFYQRALDGGLSVDRIVASVFAVNMVLGALALATVCIGSRSMDAAALAAGSVLVAALLMKFNRARS